MGPALMGPVLMGMIGIGMIGIGRRIGKRNWKGESLDKRQEESLDKRQEGRRSKTPGGQVPLMQPHCPKKGTTKADQLALGQ